VIFEAITAVKIANDAIGAIKEFAGHIHSVGELGPQLTKLADAKEQIEKKAKDGDMEAFFELEKINQREAEIRQLFIYSGRPGLWTDYQKFIANRKQLKENERKRIEQAKARKRRQIKEWTTGIIVTIAALSAIGIFGYILYWLITTKGR
jgi:preprotein translocase subunit Sss1